MKTGRLLVFYIFVAALVLLSLSVTGCGTNEDDGDGTTDIRYTCEGTLSQCLKIKSGWSLDVKTTDEVIVDPSVVALPDGRFRIYGNAMGWPRRVISLISTDGGVTFALEPGDRLVADADHDAFAPNVVSLPNGDFRMYLTDQRRVVGSEGAEAFISAISSDGLNFAWESGERLRFTEAGEELYGIRVSNVVLLPNGTYRLYYVGLGAMPMGQGNKVLSAVSTDGLVFTRESGVRFDPKTTCPPGSRVNPKLYVDLAGTYHMFSALAVCDDMGHSNEKTGIFEGTSTDGLTFSFSKVAIVQGYYIKSLYHGNLTDPFVNTEDPMLVWTPAGLRMYFSCGGPADNPPVRYYSVCSPSIH